MRLGIFVLYIDCISLSTWSLFLNSRYGRLVVFAGTSITFAASRVLGVYVTVLTTARLVLVLEADIYVVHQNAGLRVSS